MKSRSQLDSANKCRQFWGVLTFLFLLFAITRQAVHIIAVTIKSPYLQVNSRIITITIKSSYLQIDSLNLLLFYAAPFPTQEEKIEADARSVYVGNVSETESSSLSWLV